MGVILNKRFIADFDGMTPTIPAGQALVQSNAPQLAGIDGDLQLTVNNQSAMYLEQTGLDLSTATALSVVFYVNRDTLTMSGGESTIMLNILTSGSLPRLQVSVSWIAGVPNFQFIKREDGGAATATNTFNVTTGEHRIEVILRKASTNVAADGSAEYYIGGVLQGSRTGMDLFDDFALLDRVRLGTMGIDVGTSGTLHLGKLLIRDDSTLPGPAVMYPLTTLWTVVSGPGTVTFGDASLVGTTASFSVDGAYVLQLTGHDGELSANDQVAITVSAAPNIPPVVNAGPDSSVILPATGTLNGAVIDDAVPVASTLAWTKISGPGTVTFGDSAAAVTTATYSLDGSYVLRLTADDTEYSVHDDINVFVYPIGGGPTGRTNKNIASIVKRRKREKSRHAIRRRF